MFLSRLNEKVGNCEKIVPVSESFWSNLKFLRMIDFLTFDSFFKSFNSFNVEISCKRRNRCV